MRMLGKLERTPGNQSNRYLGIAHAMNGITRLTQTHARCYHYTVEPDLPGYRHGCSIAQTWCGRFLDPGRNVCVVKNRMQNGL